MPVFIPPCAVVVLRRLMAQDNAANERMRDTIWQRGTRRGTNTDSMTGVKQASELTNKSQRTHCGVSGARLCRPRPSKHKSGAKTPHSNSNQSILQQGRRAELEQAKWLDDELRNRELERTKGM